MQVATTIAAVRTTVSAAKAEGKSVGLVPTMGALHEGHLSLVDRSVAECDLTVVSIFVNPTQFAPHEDADRYPRTLADDCQLLAARNCDLVFAPDEREIYPAGDEVSVEVGSVAQPLEGAARPTHFRGVATVVLKLFQIVTSDRAYFGRKDYQQSLVIQELVRCLHLPVKLEICPTIREPDGLAKSSRNAYLQEQERSAASSIWESLQLAEQLVRQGTTDVSQLESRMKNHLRSAGIEQIDYIAFLKEGSVLPIRSVDCPTVVALAVRVGNARLIDNHTIDPTAD